LNIFSEVVGPTYYDGLEILPVKTPSNWGYVDLK
jgi:hypothetical protein